MKWKKASLLGFVKSIKRESWTEVKTYTLPAIRFALNEGDISQSDYEKLKAVIMKKFNKKDYEL